MNSRTASGRSGYWPCSAKRAVRSASVSPAMYSMTMKYVSLMKSKSSTRMMLGWRNPATALASVWNRPTKLGSAARCEWSTLRATSCPNPGWRARYTVAIPPRPNTPMIS
ncbi:MAG: hypothetical protein BWY79_02083 [Actinobacteria bacterium ADurb.Bin444]|nr:MAG: hypothetical protein BWY79_02083 [Actinobacteria bacterium ADurb.Bin444]